MLVQHGIVVVLELARGLQAGVQRGRLQGGQERGRDGVVDRLPAEVAVVGEPDELRGEVVAAHVVLADGARPGPEFETELQDLVRSGYSAHAYPRRIHIVGSLPKTPSGKIQRFLLRRAEHHG